MSNNEYILLKPSGVYNFYKFIENSDVTEVTKARQIGMTTNALYFCLHKSLMLQNNKIYYVSENFSQLKNYHHTCENHINIIQESLNSKLNYSIRRYNTITFDDSKSSIEFIVNDHKRNYDFSDASHSFVEWTSTNDLSNIYFANSKLILTDVLPNYSNYPYIYYTKNLNIQKCRILSTDFDLQIV